MQPCDAVELDPTRRSEDVEDLEKSLHKRIVGQDAAIEKLVEVYQVYLAKMHAPNRPISNLLFLGPTGSGKTRVVEALAESLFGDPRACIKVDCAEFQHSHEIAKLIGSPPGYLGHRETHPLLTQEALNQWHTDNMKLSILLFDEIEKASDSLWKLLLGILDKATITLGDNRRVDLSSCVIIMTSNLGAHEMSLLSSGGMGFHTPKETAEANDLKIFEIATGAAKRKFDPEFMNRIDKTVVFKTLQDEHLRKILNIELEYVQMRVASESIVPFIFSCTSRFKAMLLAEGTDPKYGARHLKRSIEKHLTFPVSKILSTKQVSVGDFIKIDIGPGGKTTFTKEGRNAIIPAAKAKAKAATVGSDIDGNFSTVMSGLPPERQQYPDSTE